MYHFVLFSSCKDLRKPVHLQPTSSEVRGRQEGSRIFWRQTHHVKNSLSRDKQPSPVMITVYLLHLNENSISFINLEYI